MPASTRSSVDLPAPFSPTTAQEAPTAHEALARSLAVIDGVRHQPALTALLFETMLHAGRDAALRAAMAVMLRDFRQRLAAVLAREGIAEPEHVAAALSAGLDGLLLHAVVDERLDVEAAGAELLALVERD
ncbi:MAG TPA: TetR family transcriptional regulator C-terminal domain-containing protein [Solirubrobacter sp.]|nr:TetR family transcriptional regulator C-terminal domain-containing protein [Solirubrobacter sp.]